MEKVMLSWIDGPTQSTNVEVLTSALTPFKKQEVGAEQGAIGKENYYDLS